MITTKIDFISNTINLSLDEKDFACLVRGGVIHHGSLRIYLQDIGFAEMERALDKAQAGEGTYQDHIKEG